MFLDAAETPCQDLLTGLVAASNKTLQDISNIVLPTKSERALNKFPIGYDWNEDQLNKEQLALLQQTDDTRWCSEDVIIIDDTFTHKTVEKIPHAGKFYDHGIHSYIWGQSLIYALYADEKTTYPLGFASTRRVINAVSSWQSILLTNSSR